MAPIKFSDGIVKNYQELFGYVQQNIISTIIAYITDSNKRQAVGLSSWIKHQVDNPGASVLNAESNIESSSNFDEQVYYVRRWVQNHIRYLGDVSGWKASEYWATAEETITKSYGDCEDGAILTYVLCRLKGVPANRLLVWCGDVTGGAHCCLFYKPSNYPLNFVALDWCYWTNNKLVQNRGLFEFWNKEVDEFTPVGYATVSSNYLRTWFLFNEDVGITKYLWSEFQKNIL